MPELIIPSGLVCGIDEAGRGPLAGPVVAAAVILDAERPIAGPTVENDAVGFVSGYFPSDLTGDAITEAADYSLIENNLPFFLASLNP